MWVDHLKSAWMMMKEYVRTSTSLQFSRPKTDFIDGLKQNMKIYNSTRRSMQADRSEELMMSHVHLGKLLHKERNIKTQEIDKCCLYYMNRIHHEISIEG